MRRESMAAPVTTASTAAGQRKPGGASGLELVEGTASQQERVLTVFSLSIHTPCATRTPLCQASVRRCQTVRGRRTLVSSE